MSSPRGDFVWILYKIEACAFKRECTPTMRTSELPEVFGVIRMSQYRDPCVQLCTAQYIEPGPGRSPHRSDYHLVENLNLHEQGLRDCEFDQDQNIRERQLLLIRYKHPSSGQLQEVYCWHLPYHVTRNGYSIPILDFQYRSWLPSEYTSVPIYYNVNRVRATAEEIQQAKLREIQHLEDGDSAPYVPWRRPSYDSIVTPQNRPSSRRQTNYPRPPTPPPPPPPRIVEVQVPVERIVIQTRVQTLPKAVGDILLASARQGSESCPIAATPFKECDKICVTSCFHVFEKESLTRWRADHTSCPVCRTKIENVVCE
jgi:hypothetical protein